MTTVAEAHLTSAERRVVDRFAELLRDDLGDQLDAVWLYGSRARGEGEPPESDIDLLVFTQNGRADSRRVVDVLLKAYEAVPDAWMNVSPLVQSREWLEGRRAIKAFFIQEVDRDKIVLYGEP
jgi:predicted nucleotidyltransferase